MKTGSIALDCRRVTATFNSIFISGTSMIYFVVNLAAAAHTAPLRLWLSRNQHVGQHSDALAGAGLGASGGGAHHLSAGGGRAG